MVNKIISISTFVAAVLLAAIFQFQNPSEVGPLGLLAVFFLLYVVVLGLTTWLLWTVSKGIAFIGKRVVTKRPPRVLSLTQAYYFSSVIALAPIMMLAMQSIGSLGVYEVILIVVFLAVGILYVSRRSLS